MTTPVTSIGRCQTPVHREDNYLSYMPSIGRVAGNFIITTTELLHAPQQPASTSLEHRKIRKVGEKRERRSHPHDVAIPVRFCPHPPPYYRCHCLSGDVHNDTENIEQNQCNTTNRFNLTTHHHPSPISLPPFPIDNGANRIVPLFLFFFSFFKYCTICHFLRLVINYLITSHLLQRVNCCQESIVIESIVYLYL